MPREVNRIDEILQIVREYWHRCPDMRLGQIVENMAYGHRGQHHHDVYYIEDDEIRERFILELVEMDRSSEIDNDKC
jgi:uncharacterized protein YihD (DUF1040 family)